MLLCMGQANAMKMALLSETKTPFSFEETLSWLFLPFLISTCFNIRTDVNGVQRRTRKEFVARV